MIIENIPYYLIPYPFNLLKMIKDIFFDAEPAKDEFDGKEIKLAVLGPNESGKTTLLNFLSGKPAPSTYQQTEGTESFSFTASSKNWKVNGEDKNINFQTKDINGNEDFMSIEWQKLIHSADMVLFIFDAYRYINETDYKRDCNQRIQFVKNTIDKACDNKDNKTKKVWLLGSRADKLNDINEAKQTIKKGWVDKEYFDFSRRFECFDFTNDEQKKAYCYMMFGKE